MRKVFGVLFLIASGFLLSIPCFTLFLELGMASWRPMIHGILLIPFIVVHFLGVIIYGPKRWKKTTAVVLISAAGHVLFSISFMWLMMHAPDTKEYFADKMPHELLFNMANGLSFNGLVILIGILLLRLDKRGRADLPGPPPVRSE